MNSRYFFNLSNIVRPTILSSLIFVGLKMLRDSVLDTVILSSSYKPIIALLNVLMPAVFDRSMPWKNGLMLEVFIFDFVFVFVLKYKFKGSVASLQFGFPKSPTLRSWMLVLLLSVLDLINFLLFSLLITGTLRAHSCYFMLLRIIDEYYKA